ncbi:hypothetical protein CBA19CS91_10690 [Paraburkholderia hospita]|nr:hypothetical protein CBA19CS91_10690 [Paraburkholderia hospita]
MTRHTSTLFVSIVSSVLLCACAGTASQTAADYHPQTEARVRVYWGANVTFYLNTACVTGEARHFVASKPGLSSLSNKTVGMPVPPDAARYFHEYIVPAGQPMTVHARISSEQIINGKRYRVTDAAKASTFVPEHGHDYEILVQDNDGPDEIFARELVSSANGTSAVPYPLRSTSACKS